MPMTDELAIKITFLTIAILCSIAFLVAVVCGEGKFALFVAGVIIVVVVVAAGAGLLAAWFLGAI